MCYAVREGNLGLHCNWLIVSAKDHQLYLFMDDVVNALSFLSAPGPFKCFVKGLVWLAAGFRCLSDLDIVFPEEDFPGGF